MSFSSEPPTKVFTNALYEKTGQQANPAGKFRYPAHSDNNPSLSITEGDDGRCLLKCFAGCDAESICRSIGLELKDLMPQNGFQSNGRASKPAKKRQTVFPSAEAAIVVLEQKLGKHSARWDYCDAEGNSIGSVIRWNLSDGSKTVRPVTRNDAGWVIGAMAEPRLLYRLPELVNANRIYVVEGEKACDAARSIGLVATTSSGGSKAAGKTGWSPLSGKEVVILPDNDLPGRKYADDVCKLLANLSPAPSVKIIELPDLPERGDIADWLENLDSKAPDDLREAVESMADNAEPVELSAPEPMVQSVKSYQPFPADCLPHPLNKLITQGAESIRCDTSYLALPMLSALASSIGNSTSLQLKKGWSVPCILWTCIVGESGSSKTPAFRLAMNALRDLEREAHQRFINEMSNFNSVSNSKDAAKEPEPTRNRFVVSDTTIEALAPILLDTPRGLLLARDELNGWFGSFDQYKSKKGADSSHWLSMYNAESVTNDRKTGEPKYRSIYIPRASVSITGGIQPAILNRSLGNEHRESGLAARFLFSYPPRVQKRWTEKEIDSEIADDYATVVGRLTELEPLLDRNGNPYPRPLQLSNDAHRRWTKYYNSHNEEHAKLTGELSAAWSKLEEIPARLAIIIHCVRQVQGNKTLANPDVVDDATMTAAIELTEWFKREARRVYAMINQTEDDRARQEFIRWIQSNGGAVTPRDVQRSQWKRETSTEAEEQLNDLAARQLGKWEHVPSNGQGGRPTRKFCLNQGVK